MEFRLLDLREISVRFLSSAQSWGKNAWQPSSLQKAIGSRLVHISEGLGGGSPLLAWFYFPNLHLVLLSRTFFCFLVCSVYVCGVNIYFYQAIFSPTPLLPLTAVQSVFGEYIKLINWIADQQTGWCDLLISCVFSSDNTFGMRFFFFWISI